MAQVRPALILLLALLLGACSGARVPLSDESGLILKAVASDVQSSRIPDAEFQRVEAHLEYSPTDREACLTRWRAANEAAELAWCEAYVMSDLLDRFEYLSDTAAAATFLTHADAVLARYDRDSKDAERGGRHTPGWPSTAYTDGKTTYWLVHTGQVIRNFARFAVIVRERKLDRFSADAERLAGTARRFFHGYDIDWDGRRYHEAGKRDKAVASSTALPFNMQATFGITAIHLHRYYGDDRYKRRAERMAGQFLEFVKVLIDGKGIGVIWPYSETTDSEDTSHAILTLQFLSLARDHAIAVTDDQYRALVKSFVARTAKGRTRFANDVRGRHESGETIADSCYRLMHIARYNAELFATCSSKADEHAASRAGSRA